MKSYRRVVRALVDCGFEISPNRFSIMLLDREVYVEEIIENGLPKTIERIRSETVNSLPF